MKRFTRLIALAMALVGVAAWPSSAAVAAATQSVTIQNMAFNPASMTVAPGTTVTWVNKDSVPHTVTVDSGNGPSSNQLQTNQSYSFTFNNAGTFNYHCTVHPQMKASITVAAAPAGAATSPTPAPGKGAGVVAPTPAPTKMPSTGANDLALIPALALLAGTLTGVVRYRLRK